MQGSIGPNAPRRRPPTLTLLYSSTAIATGGLLEGRVRTIDGRLDLVLAKPQDLRGSGPGPGQDPYQLLAAAYSASFLASLAGARSQDGPAFPPDAAVQATRQPWDSGFARMEASDCRSHLRSGCPGSRKRTLKR